MISLIDSTCGFRCISTNIDWRAEPTVWISDALIKSDSVIKKILAIAIGKINNAQCKKIIK